MNESKLNKITKEDVLEWWRLNSKNYPTIELADLIYRVTVCGEEYANNKDMGYYDMSYICRLFNITAYGVYGSQNPIKGRYRKYRENEDIQNVIVSIIRENPNGFKSESPRFDDLLEERLAAHKTGIAKNSDSCLKERKYAAEREQTAREPKENVGDKEKLVKYGKIAGIVIAVFCIIRACSFVGDKLNDLSDYFSNDYKFEAFTYDGMMYAGNKKGSKPDGLCAVMPMRSSGTTYALGEYDESKIEGFGILCSSDIPLQASESGNSVAIDYDDALLRIRMGEMKESVLNGYGIVFDSPEELTIGEYKKGQLKKYGCKVSLDENGNISSVVVVKKDKVKKQLKDGTYKGITYYPETGLIVIDDFSFTISAGMVSLKTDGVDLSVKGRRWSFDLFNEDTDEGIYIDYTLGENINCKVITNDSKGVRVDESEMPITYGKE